MQWNPNLIPPKTSPVISVDNSLYVPFYISTDSTPNSGWRIRCVVVWKMYCAKPVTILLKTTGYCCTLHQRKKVKTTCYARARLFWGILSICSSNQACSWLACLCFMYWLLKEVNLKKSTRTKAGDWWIGAHEDLYLSVTSNSLWLLWLHLWS